MYVVPKQGYIVRDPVSMVPLPPHGRRVAESQYWHQRIAQGDVTEAPEPIEAPPEAAAPASKE